VGRVSPPCGNPLTKVVNKIKGFGLKSFQFIWLFWRQSRKEKRKAFPTTLFWASSNNRHLDLPLDNLDPRRQAQPLGGISSGTST
jgi:hypothetical protein